MFRLLTFAAVAALAAAPVHAQTTHQSVPDADRGHRRRHQRELRRVRDHPRCRRRRSAAHDAPGRRARHAPDVRQHDARQPLQRQLRRQDRDARISTSTRRTGTSACSRRATSAASRASRSIRSSTSAARRGYGKFYTYTDTTNMTPTPDFTPARRRRARTTRCCSSGRRRIPAAATYDGGAPRELFRAAQPFANHNGGQLAFNPLTPRRARRTSACSTSASPMAAAAAIRSNLAQNLARRSARSCASIRSARTARTASTASRRPIRSSTTASPTRSARSTPTASAIRSASRGTAKNGNMFVADIGQNIVEEISPVTAGANLGWNKWEGSYTLRQPRRSISTSPRSEAGHDLAGRRVRSHAIRCSQRGGDHRRRTSIARTRSSSSRTC